MMATAMWRIERFAAIKSATVLGSVELVACVESALVNLSMHVSPFCAKRQSGLGAAAGWLVFSHASGSIVGFDVGILDMVVLVRGIGYPDSSVREDSNVLPGSLVVRRTLAACDVGLCASCPDENDAVLGGDWLRNSEPSPNAALTGDDDTL
jgi:hypothetical protein